MINIKIVLKILGILLFLEAFLLLVCSLFPLFYHEDDLVPFLLSAGITTAVGMVLFLIGRNASKQMNRKDGYLVVTFSWILFASLGTLPFLLGGIHRHGDQCFPRNHVGIHHHRSFHHRQS